MMKRLGILLLVLCLISNCALAERKDAANDEHAEIDYSVLETRARTALYKAFRCPQNMELAYLTIESLYTPAFFTTDGKTGYDYSEDAYRQSLAAAFHYNLPDGSQANANALFDRGSSQLVKLFMTHSRNDDANQFSTNADHITQEMIDRVTKQVEADIGRSDITWHVMRDDLITTNWGLCLPVCALMEDCWQLTIYIGCDDGQLRGMGLLHGRLVDQLPAEEYPNG